MGSLAKIALVILVIVVGLGVIRFAMMGRQSQKTAGSAPTVGSLAPCPDKPNCVSSQAPDEAHRIEPLPLSGTSAEGIQKAHSAILEMPGASVTEAGDDYLRAEFTSRLFGFVDDLELLADDEAEVLHVRSASRVGYSDLGANRKRVEVLRGLLAE